MMRNSLLILFLVVVFTVPLLNAQTTAIPDINFENYLETHAQDGTVVSFGDSSSMGDGIANNGLVLTDRISDALLLDVSGLNISNLTGIEDFTALENLFCSDNNLEDLDITNNTNLLSLLCGANSLTTLSVSNNINLETLNFANNQIQSIDVSNNLTLESLTASGNQLSTIDVSNNSELTLLSVSNNRILGELVVSNNTNLENLFCASNQISTLNLSTNTLIKNLDASDNALISLDLSTINSVLCPDPQTDPITICQGPVTINVSRNLLTNLIVANGYNDLFSTFNASDNPELFCIQIDDGFVPSGWLKDDWAYFTENTCEDIYTYVPDDNFEQALINQGYDDTLDNLVLTDNINAITSLNISNASISDLTGIEVFIALEVLDCSINTIESIVLSDNTALLQLDVSNNDLTFLDLNANLALTALNCSSNLISDLNINALVDLNSLNCSNNSLTNLDVSSNILLSDLDCSFNQLESLDVTSNTALVSFFCNDNNLFALNFNNGNNTSVTAFNVTNNSNLFCIQVDDVAFSDSADGWQKDASASYSLGCGTYVPDDNFEQALIDQGIDSDNTLNNFVATADINTITTLDVSNLMIVNLTGIEDFLALEELNCSNNEILGLNLSNNVSLEILDCSINLIEDLNLAVNASLTSLLCNYNVLKTLNVENGNNGALTVFNSTENPNLFCINVDDAIVASIPASWQKDAIASYDGDCANNRFTAIPDAFFEQALINLGYDDVIDSQVLTANIEHVLTLNVSDESISDLTGIQDFKSLVELDCSGNFLDTIDVSGMISLERLNCSSNYLLTNDVNDTNGLLNTTGTINLIELYCASNNLNDLDISQNPNLELLDCADNNISQLNLNGITSLRTLNCSNNNLTSLNISNNNVLEDVNCNNNQLTDLTTIGTNNNTLTDLSCANNSLSNLQITNYQALTTLSCGSNELTQLNVTNNTALNFISASNNQISDINLLSNINLVEVSVAQNDLTELDVSLNTLLERLNCDFNEITGLDISANISLEVLSCSNNQITDLDVSANVNLIDLNASSNVLTSLNLSNSLEYLKSFNIGNNQIEEDLDLTTIAISACIFQSSQSEYCPETISINVSNNFLSFINIQNGINTEIANFNAANNPNLTCIQVDDAANVNPSWIKDETTEYNIDCNFGETYVPDDNFEQALIDLGYDSGPLNDYVLTENIVLLTSLDLSGNGIMDFTGIQDFEALEELDFSNNVLGELNLSSNINLISVDCSNNNLTLLDVTDITSLEVLNCSNNELNFIDLVTNINLFELNIANNAFTSFLVSDILSLQVFNCDNNQIEELDFQQNLFLTSISCQNNLLETLNIRNGQNPILTSLNAINNPDLLCVETDNGTVPSGAVWTIDATAQFAINCFFGETYVPDDNFEQALIDLGYDTGPLDDYVFTEMIEDVTFLNVSGREIEDLTGIEDFIDLTNLNVENNSISMIDLSNNTSLLDLDASGNQLTDIDISLLINLLDIDVSSNSISQINFDTNLSLTDINVSINLLENINVDGLMSLEKLNCASNLISSLNVTQNTSLNLLFCQSNLLIADQLNLQNGSNEILELFNATNNSDLACILVDDPVAVISNTDGIYDNWFKDDSSSYKTVCSDADNDGVPNEDDLCPTTEFGAAVDLFGCAIPNLPNDNFAISITGETCLNSNNGIITIVAQELYTYDVVLEREDFYEEYNFTNDIDIFNLLAGTYQMCITIEEWPNYESCYTIVITQPDPLEIFASRVANTNDFSLNMSGSTSYNIKFNGDAFTTHSSAITLQLEQGVNRVEVSTDLECQGVYEEKIILTDDFLVYPNPFRDEIKINNGKEDGEVVVNVYSTFGQLVLNKTFINQGIEMSVDTGSLSAGMYLISIQTEAVVSTYKMVKK